MKTITMEALGFGNMFTPPANNKLPRLLHPFIWLRCGEDEGRQVIPIWLELFPKPVQPQQLEAIATGPKTQYSKFQTVESWMNLPRCTLVENGSELIVTLATFWSWATLTRKYPAVVAFTPVIFTHEYTNHILAGLGWE